MMIKKETQSLFRLRQKVIALIVITDKTSVKKDHHAGTKAEIQQNQDHCPETSIIDSLATQRSYNAAAVGCCQKIGITRATINH